MNFEPVELSAGPVRLKLADGELRYLTVGGKEILRRVFFAVRTKTWDTPAPSFTSIDIEKGKDRFTARFTAVNSGLGGVDYAWTGELEGRSDGTVTFRVSGAPQKDMESNRIGLCALFGTPEVCGVRYTLVGKGGQVRKGTFPDAVNAPLTFETEFSELRTDEVVVTVRGSEGTLFSLEDQRNFADSSFKAYAPLPYAYPSCPKGERYEAVVTIHALRPRPAPKPRPTTLTFGAKATGRVPQLLTGSTGERNWFHGINHEREKTRAAAAVSFAYFPCEHLFDDDTLFENVPVIVELAESARKIAPSKPIDIHHIALDPTGPRPRRDPRNASSFGGAWTAACVGWASVAGVRSARFDSGPGHAARILRALSPYVGQPAAAALVRTDALGRGASGFRLGETYLVVNQSDRRQKMRLEGIAPGSYAALVLDGTSAPSTLPPPRPVSVSPGRPLERTFNPREVFVLAPAPR
jgi:hypothetical protein